MFRFSVLLLFKLLYIGNSHYICLCI